MPDYDLAVAYRIYPKVSKNPPIFKNDKYQLAEFCLKSFKESLGKLRPKMFVILDGCPSGYEDLFRKYFDDLDLEFIRVAGIGNHKTFMLQIKTLMEQEYSDIIYFAEDDYYYMPDQFRDMLDLIHQKQEAHFITPYDHLDYYSMSLHDNRYRIIFSGRRHWRTASSTCMTFMTTKQIFSKTKREFSSYQRGNLDVSIWMSLTKYDVLNPFKILHYMLFSRGSFIFVAYAWWYGWIQIIFKRKWNLWVPLPSIATHMEGTCLAPTIGEEVFFPHKDSIDCRLK